MKKFSLFVVFLTLLSVGASVLAQDDEDEARDFLEVSVFGGGSMPGSGISDWMVPGSPETPAPIVGVSLARLENDNALCRLRRCEATRQRQARTATAEDRNIRVRPRHVCSPEPHYCAEAFAAVREALDHARQRRSSSCRWRKTYGWPRGQDRLC